MLFYSQMFSLGKRKPIGFEIEIIDYSGVFNSDDIVGYNESFGPGIRYDENSELDDKHIYSVCINDPTKLEANTWHIVEINFSNYVNIEKATFAVQIQLVGDVFKLITDHPDIFDRYSNVSQAELLTWFVNLGNHNEDGDNFFNIRKPRTMFYRDAFFDWSEGNDSGYDRVFWRMGREGERADYKPYSCGFGSDPWDDNSTGNGNSNNGNTNSNGNTNTGNTNGNGNTNNNGTNPTPPPDHGYIDPTTNHKHAIGMHSVRYKMSGQSNWHDTAVSLIKGSHQKMDIRVKVKEKEKKKWKNIYVDLYYSSNRWFSRSHDTKIDTQRIKTLDKKEKKSVYFKNIDLSHLKKGHHYYFADIRYGDEHNISSRSDTTEYIIVDIQDPPPVQQNTQPERLTPAVLQAIRSMMRD